MYIYIYVNVFPVNYNICQYQPASKLLRINIQYTSVQHILCSAHHFCCMCCATYSTLLKFKRIKKQAQQLAEVCGEPQEKGYNRRPKAALAIFQLILRPGIHLLQLLRLFFDALELKQCAVCCAAHATKMMQGAKILLRLHV